MKNLSKYTPLMIFGLMLNGCGNNLQVNTANVVQTNRVAENVNVANNTAATNTETAQANTTTQIKKENVELPVTLPVLDALFNDDTFAKELTDKIQLPVEQVAKLKELAHQSVEKLADRKNPENGSTTESVKQAEQQIRGVIGDDKSNQLFSLIQEKWAGGNAEKVETEKANTIPGDTRVVVNSPAYRMDIFKEGKLVKSYKIGIGYPEFPLATGIRKAQAIIFNPTWTPPDEAWVKGKIKPGQKVEAGSSMNPLGPIKIPIGSPALIHGGKSAGKLGGFASHGCVGLTNNEVQDFALNLADASGTKLTIEDIKNYQKEKEKTKNLSLSQPMKVELRYETIVVVDGTLHIYRDVYERKTNTLSNLKNVLAIYGVNYDSLSDLEKQKIISALKDMNKDGKGQPIAKNVEEDQSEKITQQSIDANKKLQDGTVTRNIKGGKEISIQLPALKGKGYPAPVKLNVG